MSGVSRSGDHARSLRRVELPRLYAIADAGALGAAPGRIGPLVESVARLAGLGVRWIQVRAKHLPDRELFQAIESTLERLVPYPEVALWIDDRVDLTACLPVAGVHLGQRDLPPGVARRVLGEERWIGLSTHDPDQGRVGQEDPAVDLVAIGPVFATHSKEGADPVVGLEGVRRARSLGDKPLVAIGGIDADSAPRVIEAGADAVAVIGALGAGNRLEADTSRLLRAVA